MPRTCNTVTAYCGSRTIHRSVVAAMVMAEVVAAVGGEVRVEVELKVAAAAAAAAAAATERDMDAGGMGAVEEAREAKAQEAKMAGRVARVAVVMEHQPVSEALRAPCTRQGPRPKQRSIARQ